MTKSSSPSATTWLSATPSSLIVPLTRAITSTTSAVTIASSVSGLRTTRSTTVIPSAMAPAARADTMSRSRLTPMGLTSVSEYEQPGRKGQEEREARVCDCSGLQVVRRVRRDEHLAHDRGQHQPGDAADQPRRKERAEDVHGRRHGPPLNVRPRERLGVSLRQG